MSCSSCRRGEGGTGGESRRRPGCCTLPRAGAAAAPSRDRRRRRGGGSRARAGGLLPRDVRRQAGLAAPVTLRLDSTYVPAGRAPGTLHLRLVNLGPNALRDFRLAVTSVVPLTPPSDGSTKLVARISGWHQPRLPTGSSSRPGDLGARSADVRAPPGSCQRWPRQCLRRAGGRPGTCREPRCDRGGIASSHRGRGPACAVARRARRCGGRGVGRGGNVRAARPSSRRGGVVVGRRRGLGRRRRRPRARALRGHGRGRAVPRARDHARRCSGRCSRWPGTGVATST